MPGHIDLRRLLSQPIVYRLFQAAIMRGDMRARHVADNIRARAGDRILDIGCGPGDILDSLPQDIDYYGFDLNPDYIAHAKQHYEKRGQFFCQNVEQANLPAPLGSFDIVIANGVIHHLNDTQAGELFRLARHALKPDGRLVTFDGCFREGQHPVARYLLTRDRGEHVRRLDEYLALASGSFGAITHRIVEDWLRLPYTHLVMECAA